MRAVRGTVTSARLVSVTKAAVIMARFADAGTETGARSDVVAYLRCASAAFEELAQVHKELRGERRRAQDEIHGGGDEANEKGEREEKRNPGLEEIDGNLKSSDLDGGIGVKGVDFEKKKDLQVNGFVLEVDKEKRKKKKRKENGLDENEVREEERSDFDGKSESVIDGKKKKKNKDRNLVEVEEDGMKKMEKKRRNSEEDGTEFGVDRVGLDGDREKRKHSDDRVVDEKELHKKKKRKTKEQQG